MKPPAREDLVVVWEGEEVSGFIVFALGTPDMTRPRELPRFGWAIEPDVKPSTHFGERWKVALWDVRVIAWPTPQEFQNSIREVLRWLVNAGYPVAWIGIEGGFADPPELLSPDAMSGMVLAAYSEETGFLAAVDLDEPIRAITDDDMVQLRDASRGLASAH